MLKWLILNLIEQIQIDFLVSPNYDFTFNDRCKKFKTHPSENIFPTDSWFAMEIILELWLAEMGMINNDCELWEVRQDFAVTDWTTDSGQVWTEMKM